MLVVRRISPRILPKPKKEVQKQGLRYENKVVKNLNIWLKNGEKYLLEHNPWFEIENTRTKKRRIICPDIILRDENAALVIEVKLTYTPAAYVKLQNLYIPAVKSVLGLQTRGLVICSQIGKPTTPIPFWPTIWSAINADPPIFLWSGYGPIT